MRTGPPAPDDRQRGNGHLGTSAAGWRAAGPLDSRWAQVAAFWALVLRQFRDYANRDAGPPPAGQERPDEEDT